MAVPYTFANASGYIPLAQLDANFASIPAFANTAGTITGNTQPNITQIGTLNSLTVTGNIQSSGYFVGDGSALTGIVVGSVPASNITGNTLSSNVLFSNLTSVGILSNLSVTGIVVASNVVANITGQVIGNVFGNLAGVASNAITATYANTANAVAGASVSGFVNNATNATNATTATYANTANAVAGANVTGTVASATNATTATYANTANVVSGANVSGTVASATTAVTATYANTANTVAGANVTGTVASATTAVSATTATYANTANVVSGANVSGTVASATTAVTATYANTANLVSGANVSGVVATATNATVAGTVTSNAQANITSVGTLTSLSVTGNVTSAAYFKGDGSLLTNLPAGNYSNANVAAYLPTYSGNVAAGNIKTNNYLYANGAPVSFTSGYGNANVANYLPTFSGNLTAGNISVLGNITGTYILGNGSLLTGITTTYGNANVAAYLPTYNGNIGAGNVLTTNIRTDNYLYANGSPVTGLGANVSSNSVTYIAPFTGASTLTGTNKWSQFVSVLDFGADPTGVADSRNAFQAALNTGKHVYIPTGNYKINSGLQMLVPGQMMSGDGRGVSVLQIDSGFNLSSSSVIDCSNLEPGAELRDFGITFAQPDTSNRASLTAYPVAIKSTTSPRATFQNLKIQGAINGIDLTGNSGGAFIELLEMSGFGTGITIDGSLDTIRINKFHYWPYNLTANQQNIFYSSGTQAMQVGRVDGLFMSEFLNISYLGMTMSTTGSGIPQVYIENSAFDTNNGIVQNGGILQVTNSYITVTTNNNLNGYIMAGTGSWAQFTNCRFLSGAPNQSMILMQNCNNCSLNIVQGHFENGVAGIPFIYVGTTVLSQSSLQVADSTFQIGGTNSYVINAVGPSSGSFNVHFINNIVQTAANATFSNPMFRFAAGNRIYMSGNRGWDKGTNKSNFIAIASDDWNWVSGNMAPGWGMSFPSPVNGFYSNNQYSA